MTTQATMTSLDPMTAADAAPPTKKRPIRLIAGAMLGVLGLGVAGYYALTAGLESTDDAQVESEVLAVASFVSGSVVKVNFVENQAVKAGDVLVELDPLPLRARLSSAEAEVTQAEAAASGAQAEAEVVEATARGQKSFAEASLQAESSGANASGSEVTRADAQVRSAKIADDQARIDLERVKSLFATNAVSQHDLDFAQNAFDAAEANLVQATAHRSALKSATVQAEARIQEARARLGQSSAVESQITQAKARALSAQARVAAAKAQRDLAAIDFSHVRITAAVSGIASRKSVTLGQLVGAGQIVAMVVPADVWVTANFKETQLHRMRTGQPAEVTVDAYPGLKLHGEVESLSGATGSRFSLLPPDNATGNFTKVVQRVPVRVKLKDVPGDKVLRPGMSADVTVDERK